MRALLRAQTSANSESWITPLAFTMRAVSSDGALLNYAAAIGLSRAPIPQ